MPWRLLDLGWIERRRLWLARLRQCALNVTHQLRPKRSIIQQALNGDDLLASGIGCGLDRAPIAIELRRFGKCRFNPTVCSLGSAAVERHAVQPPRANAHTEPGCEQ